MSSHTTGMTFIPRSLFWRIALLLLAVIVIAQLTLFTLFRQDRAGLVARQFGDTKIAQIQALRAALASPNAGDRAENLRRLGMAYGARLVPVSERHEIGHPPRAPVMIDLAQHLEARLGEGSEVRLGGSPERGVMLWIRLVTPNGDYWAGFPIGQRPPGELPLHLLGWSAFIFVLLLASAWGFARLMNRPLQQLNRAVAVLAKGAMPQPLPETGPSEIAELSRSFNQMAVNLRQMENDRALLLAGVSHDLRTPLARLRLGVEMTENNEAAKQGMIDDIEEMDKIINQFLDFARGEENLPAVQCDVNQLVAHVVERFQRKNYSIAFTPAPDLPRLWLRETAIERLLGNLIDNAFRYGSVSAEVSTGARADLIVLDVADRGPGIPPDQVEYLKLPFTRLNTARGGAIGSGLGLAIVERIARLHGGTLQLLSRVGGGTIARVCLPKERSARTSAPASSAA